MNELSGGNNISAAFSLGEQARIKYQEQSYLEAAQLYDKATDLDPYEYSYFENAALSYYSIQDGENALKRINVVVDQMNPLNGKCEYIKGLIYCTREILPNMVKNKNGHIKIKLPVNRI